MGINFNSSDSSIVMKYFSSMAWFLCIISVISDYIACYLLGYYEKPIFGMWPIFGVLIQITVFSLLFCAWLICLAQKKSRLFATLLIFSAFSLYFLKHTVLKIAPGEMIVYGLRDRIMRNYSIGDLRRFALDIDKIPGQPISFDRGLNGKELLLDDLYKLGLNKKYPFLDWMNRPTHIYEKMGIIEVQWGGALMGYWAFNICLDGRRVDPGLSTMEVIRYLRVSDDIIFVFGG